MEHTVRRIEDRTAVMARELGAGVAALVATAFAAPVISTSPAPTGRALLMAIVTGTVTALISDWRARLGVTATSMVIFVAFVEPFPGATNGVAAPWAFTPLIALAALLGTGYRLLARASRSAGPNQPDNHAG
jgi:hypothetical protein